MTYAETYDALAQWRDNQLASWPEARKNYDALASASRKTLDIGVLEGCAQFNPARSVSTGADISAGALKQRPCFLCRQNRPECQESLPILPDWEFLVNPFPILPLHFTIASSRHIPQQKIPLDMASMAEAMPGMAVFFNGAKAGASAPDHLHCQAVMASELPLLKYLQNGKNADLLPFKVIHRIITPDIHGMELLRQTLNETGIDKTTGRSDPELLNAFMWIGETDGLLHTAIIPRSAHRPACYGRQSEKEWMISPGAIDMCGLIITPRETDFRKIDSNIATNILTEVAL